MISESISDPSAVTFHFNGDEIKAQDGQSVAAALLNVGARITRITRIHSQPRGVFCGIGICFDCLVVIDGVPNQRACLTDVRQGMKVEIQDGVGDYAGDSQP
ncbi:MAG: (2Fe-2S)-binding protein [Actinobacteria bacterium]|nr:(2Fe-2S)-binding protein [Actinomycetota bacterium]